MGYSVGQEGNKARGRIFFQAKNPLQSNPSSQVRHYTVLQYCVGEAQAVEHVQWVHALSLQALSV